MARLGKSASIKVASIIVLATVVGTGFQNCSKSLPDEAKSSASSINIPGSTALAVSAGKSELSGLETTQLTGSGGTPPYVFTVVTGSGTIDSMNIFTAPATSESDVVEIRDAKNSTAHVTLNITAALTLSFSSNLATEKIKLTASGGMSPYSFQIVAGIGTLSGDEFTPGAAVPSATMIQVTDSTGKTAQASLSVAWPARVTLYKFPDLTGAGYGTLNTDPNAFAAYGYANQGVAFHLFQTASADMVQVTKCQYAGLAYYTSHVIGSATCPYLWTTMGVVGYISTVARPNTVPVYTNTYSSGMSADQLRTGGMLGTGSTVAGYVMAP